MPASTDQTVVLVGLGHTHAHILLEWAKRPPRGARLICISDQPQASYSGMLPGVLAGQYAVSEMLIDLSALCRAAGARLVISRWESLDRERREIICADGTTIAYDWLSIGIGSRPNLHGVRLDKDAPLIAIKPMQSVVDRLNDLVTQARRRRAGEALRVVVVGGGAGGFEVACCLPHFLERHQVDSKFTVITRSSDILPSFSARVREVARRHLQQLGIQLFTGYEVREVTGDQLVARRVDAVPATHAQSDQSSTGKRDVGIEVDLVVWLAEAVGASVLERTGLPIDERGFLEVRRTLQSVRDTRIFAVGDAGTIAPEPLAKAGVFAVREGPILWQNLCRSLAGKPLVEYHPQRSFLQILNLGNGRAIAAYRGWSSTSRWAWWLKNHLDRSFMRAFV